MPRDELPRETDDCDTKSENHEPALMAERSLARRA